MRFTSVDIETSGINPETDQILELGMVMVDTKEHPSTWREFRKAVKHDRYEGSAYALALNARLLKELSDDRNNPDVVYIRDLRIAVSEFLVPSETYVNPRELREVMKLNIAAKNPQFDLGFLNRADTFKGFTIHKRVLDPAIMYADFINDEAMPDLSECKRRAGLDEIVTHNALEDAWDVVYLILVKMGWNLSGMLTDEGLTEEFGAPTKERQANPIWQMTDNMIITRTGSNHPFNKYKVVKRTADCLDVEHISVWNFTELSNTY